MCALCIWHALYTLMSKAWMILLSLCCTPAAFSAAVPAPLPPCRDTSHRMLIQCKQEDVMCSPQTSAIIIYVYSYMGRYMSVEYSVKRLVLHSVSFIAWKLICYTCPLVAFYKRCIYTALYMQFTIKGRSNPKKATGLTVNIRLLTHEKWFYLRFKMIPEMIHFESCKDFHSVCPKEVSQKALCSPL